MESFDNRRKEPRAKLGGMFANKYIDGMPYAVEILDASAAGIAVRRISEPASSHKEAFALELYVGDGDSHLRLFTWARRVRSDGDRESYRILAVDPLDRARLRKFLRTLPEC